MIKLLHVEDDVDIRDITQIALEISGEFNLIQCASGKEALECVIDYVPDILLLDMMMPGMTGLQTLERLRQIPALENVPAIFMTARTRRAELEELRKLRAVEVINKPFDPMDLANQIKVAMTKISKENTP